MDSLDRSSGSSRLMVVTELSQIKELVKQLDEQLVGGSHDVCKHLASQIFSVTERSIGIITSCDLDGCRKRCAADASSLAELADVQPFKATKKRKMKEKRKTQVKVSSAGGGETPVDDGHSWRKYGQKEILGAKYPRAYYRCTHRSTKGCAATKQVQRTDEDPALFDVFYLGTHTCGVPQDQSVKLEVLPAVAGESQGWSATTPFGLSSTPASACLAPERSPLAASPSTSDSNRDAFFPLFDAAEWRAQSELQEVVSALVVAGTPPVPDMDMGVADELLDIDISCFFA